MPRIYLLRHGETVWNTEQRLQGQLDSPLTETGQRQAEGHGEKLRSLLPGDSFRLVSSPLGRTVATAKIVAAKIGIKPEHIELEDRLKEVSFGNWEGKTRSEVMKTDLSRFESRLKDRWSVRPPGGENYQDVAIRLQSWLSELNDETIVVVSHGTSGRILRGIHANIEPNEMPNLDQRHEAIFLLLEGGIIERV